MSYSKVIPIGSVGQIEIKEEGGSASVKVSIAESVGGGDVAGVAKASLSAEIDISAIQLIDAGLSLVESKYPAIAGMVAMLKAAIDAEAAKV